MGEIFASFLVIIYGLGAIIVLFYIIKDCLGYTKEKIDDTATFLSEAFSKKDKKTELPATEWFWFKSISFVPNCEDNLHFKDPGQKKVTVTEKSLSIYGPRKRQNLPSETLSEAVQRGIIEEQFRYNRQYLLRDIVYVTTNNNDSRMVIQVKESRFDQYCGNIQFDTGRVSGAKPLKDRLDKMLVSASKGEGTPTP